MVKLAKAGKNQGDSKKMAPPPKEVEEDSEDEEMSEDEDDESSGEEVIVYSSMLNCLKLQNGDLKQVVLDVGKYWQKNQDSVNSYRTCCNGQAFHKVVLICQDGTRIFE